MMNVAGYSTYAGRPNMRSAGLQLSISKEGRFSLNKAVGSLFHEETVEHVLLQWNASTRRIALKPISKKDPRALVMHYAKNGRGAGFNAKHFLGSFVHYDLSKGRTFDAEWNAEEGRLEIPIGGETVEGSLAPIKRSKKSAA